MIDMHESSHDEGNSNDINEQEEEEKKHFQDVVSAFRSYRYFNIKKLLDKLQYISSLPHEQQRRLQEHKEHLHKMQLCISKNYEIIKQLLQNVSHVFENKDYSDGVSSSTLTANLHDLEKLHAVFKQIYREWSVEGKKEREMSFKPILDELFEILPLEENGSKNVLVPGVGLGRLAYEIAKRGYVCQGNEISLFMLFASNFIINKSNGVEKYQVYPWIHQSCNHYSSSDQLKSVTFPDEDPSDIPLEADFSIAAGAFTDIYTDPDTWDCVITCFFIDTGHNIVSYIDTIWKILKPDGIWINLGPLLYHHADSPDQNSIELSYEEIKRIIEQYGFCYLKEETNILTPYCQCSNSLLRYEYKSILFVCRKLANAVNSGSS